jgi:hypothetical protein
MRARPTRAKNVVPFLVVSRPTFSHATFSLIPNASINTNTKGTSTSCGHGKLISLLNGKEAALGYPTSTMPHSRKT